MKYALYSLLAVAVMVGLSSSAFAEGVKHQKQSASPYTTMEPAAGDPSRQLTLDSRDIEEVQNTLNRRGYDSGPVDGIMGPMTKRALRSFQQDNDLAVTGNANSETLAELGISTRSQGTMQERGMNQRMEMNDSQRREGMHQRDGMNQPNMGGSRQQDNMGMGR